MNFLFQEAPPISWCIFLCRCIDNFSLCTYLLIPSWQFIIYFACNIMTLVFNWYHTYSLCSVCRQLTHCARLNITNIICKHSVVLSPSCLCVPDAEPAICIIVAAATATRRRRRWRQQRQRQAQTTIKKRVHGWVGVRLYIFWADLCPPADDRWVRRKINQLDENIVIVRIGRRGTAWWGCWPHLRIRPIEVLGCKTRDDDDEESDDDEQQMATPVRWYATRFTSGNWQTLPVLSLPIYAISRE